MGLLPDCKLLFSAVNVFLSTEWESPVCWAWIGLHYECRIRAAPRLSLDLTLTLSFPLSLSRTFVSLSLLSFVEMESSPPLICFCWCISLWGISVKDYPVLLYLPCPSVRGFPQISTDPPHAPIVFNVFVFVVWLKQVRYEAEYLGQLTFTFSVLSIVVADQSWIDPFPQHCADTDFINYISNSLIKRPAWTWPVSGLQSHGQASGQHTGSRPICFCLRSYPWGSVDDPLSEASRPLGSSLQMFV